MISKKIRNRIAIGLVVGVVGTAGAYNAFGAVGKMLRQPAATEASIGNENKNYNKMERNRALGGDNNLINNLIEKEIIDQETAEKMQEYLTQKAEELKAEFEGTKNNTPEERKNAKDNPRNNRLNIFEGMVEAGIITQEQLDKINAAMPEPQQFEGKEIFNRMCNFDNMVEEGILDQTTADALTEFINKKTEEMKAEFEKIKDLTEEEKKEYISNGKDKKFNLLEEALEAGIITQEQLDKINANRPEQPQFGGRGMFERMCNFSGMVEAGIIDQTTADALTEFINKKTEEMKVEFEKIKDLTEEERKEYIDNNKNKKQNILEEALEAGIITQEQLEKIQTQQTQNFPAERTFDKTQSGGREGFRIGKQMNTAKTIENI